MLGNVQVNAYRKEQRSEERLKGSWAHMAEGIECQATGCALSNMRREALKFSPNANL